MRAIKCCTPSRREALRSSKLLSLLSTSAILQENQVRGLFSPVLTSLGFTSIELSRRDGPGWLFCRKSCTSQIEASTSPPGKPLIDCHHHFDASGNLNAMFDKIAERSLMNPLAGTKHTYVTLAIMVDCQFLALFSSLLLLFIITEFIKVCPRPLREISATRNMKLRLAIKFPTPYEW